MYTRVCVCVCVCVYVCVDSIFSWPALAMACEEFKRYRMFDPDRTILRDGAVL